MLELYRHDDRVRERVEAAVHRTKDTTLRSELEQFFEA